jgi:predicted TIM-barrel fold metal-dependent hydrolase
MATSRRAFLGGGVLACARARAQTFDIPIIDTHIHLFDTARPQGVPWPGKDNAVLYRPAMPERYRRIATPLGIRGAIEVECSPWVEDNQWVLDVAGKDSIIVGTVGNLEPGKPEFPKQLERFARNPLFRGIRYGNLWGRSLAAELARSEFVADLKRIAEAGLALDTANPNLQLIEAAVRVTDAAPGLRLIIDHLPQLDPPLDAAARKSYESNLRELARRPQVYVKLSQVLRRVKGRVPLEPAFYRDRLDSLFDTFGEDRVLYGSDWPNSDQWGEYPAVLNVVRDCFLSKGRAIAEKYFWKNSAGAYGWRRREPAQPLPTNR